MRLTEVFRQAAESRIVVSAHAINEGRMPELVAAGDGDFYFVDARRLRRRRARRIVELVAERIPKRFGLDPLRDIQVLCPMHRGAAGVEALNARAAEAPQPARLAADAPRIERLGTAFHAGDKVMQIVNDYDKDVFNGDIGRDRRRSTPRR